MVNVEFAREYEKQRGDKAHPYEFSLPIQTGESVAIQQAKADRLARANLEGIAKALGKTFGGNAVVTHDIEHAGGEYKVNATIYLTGGTKPSKR